MDCWWIAGSAGLSALDDEGSSPSAVVEGKGRVDGEGERTVGVVGWEFECELAMDEMDRFTVTNDRRVSRRESKEKDVGS